MSMNCPVCGISIDTVCPTCGCAGHARKPTVKCCETCHGSGMQKVSLEDLIELFCRPINPHDCDQLRGIADIADQEEMQKREKQRRDNAEMRARRLHAFDEHNMTEFVCVICKGRGTMPA